MTDDLLIVEDLLLLLLDDETGTPAAAGTLHYALGGAVLTELALLGRVETDGRPGLNGPKLRATGDGPLPDPLLQSAYDRVAERPRGVQTLLLEIGTRLWDPLIERLVARGLIERERKRVLGLFRMTMLPAADTAHEAAVRRQVRAVLEEDAQPDPRTAALVAMLSASGALPQLRPQLAWSSKAYHRGKELEKGNWGAEAVTTAVLMNTAAIAAASAATITTVVVTANP